jgi:8-oxo-dGTP pyrophosphatase MutT (NUDIX family)
MRSEDSRLATAWSRSSPSPKFLRLAHLRKLRKCEQVAAVCYRVRAAGIEFLLVQTRGGRWTFPKGGAEPGLTHAQAAALEAFEEAGVHGRMEEASFTRYFRGRPGDTRNFSASSAGKGLAVSAHLCEVSRLDPPQEFNRNRTWFSPEKAKRHLREGRPADYGTALARVVDRAVNRIQRLREANNAASDVLERNGTKGGAKSGHKTDALQKVQFIDSVRRTSGTAERLGSDTAIRSSGKISR